jgi:hypothetical protein
MPKSCKYEGERVDPLFSAAFGSHCRARSIDCSLGESLMLFILAAESFSKIFTTYSHAPSSCPASGLEIRNQPKKRQEKKLILFFIGEEKFLD